jgi:hypothetical protein
MTIKSRLKQLEKAILPAKPKAPQTWQELMEMQAPPEGWGNFLADDVANFIKGDPVLLAAFEAWSIEMDTERLQRVANGEYIPEVAGWLDRMPALPAGIQAEHDLLLKALE